MSADNNNDNNGDGCENHENDGLENVVGNVSVTAHSGNNGEDNEHTPLTTPQAIENELDNDPYSEDDINLIEKYETGFFIQDKMMYRPFKIFPPSRSRII